MVLQLTTAGAFLKTYPMVLGTDVAGEVHEVGEGVTHVKKGDRVLGYVHPIHVTTYTYHNILTATPSRL
jgi:NADPH:quinone reductase-like Zn-dependent oxidoreductase